MIVALTLLAASLALAVLPPQVMRIIPERHYEAQLVRVVDGDTIEVTVTARAATRLPGREVELSTSAVETVRLAGMNAPEMHGKCDQEKMAARAAKLFLEERLRGAPLELVTRGEETERYGRVLADVQIAGVSVSAEMVLRGLAVPYHGERRDPLAWCK